MSPDNRIAVCPGSYDPITNGHLDVISRASAMFDKVIVAVVNLPMRKGGTLFTAEERVAFIEHATAHLEQRRGGAVQRADGRVRARSAGPRRSCADCARSPTSSTSSSSTSSTAMQAPDIESVYLMASAKYSFIRSSGVKELATFGGRIDGLVPDEVAQALKERIGR